MVVAERMSLGLRTSDGRPLMHKFYRQAGEPAGLLIAFPGNHYGMDGPLLYYPCEMLQAAGWDTLALSYGFQTAVQELGDEALPGLIGECTAALHTALSARSYPRLALLGKSLGAGLVAYLCGAEAALAGARAVYLTPALGTPLFDPLLARTSQPALLAMGTADRFYDPQALERLKAGRPFELVLVEGADHSMDVPGDLAASLQAVRQVVTAVLEFLAP
jgi:predicted alpha/beta-hydrolase family hydrolase